MPRKGWHHTNPTQQFQIKLEPFRFGDDHLPELHKSTSLVWVNIPYKQHCGSALWNNLSQVWFSSVYKGKNLNLPTQSTTGHKLLMRPTKKSSLQSFPFNFFEQNRIQSAMHLEQPWARRVEKNSRALRVQMKHQQVLILDSKTKITWQAVYTVRQRHRDLSLKRWCQI